MRISVIIPTLNEARHVASAIENAWIAGADEVVVVDGGSSDGTVDVAGALECRLLTTLPGRGRQLHFGAQHAIGDVLLFLHADNFLAPSGCDQIRSSVGLKGAVCGAFRQRIAHRRMIYRAIEFGNAWRVRLLNLAYGDQGIFVTRSVYFAVGGFDDNLAIMEDLQFSLRIRKLHRFLLLRGPIQVDSRRWEANGVTRQTITNWRNIAYFLCGGDPLTIARWYGE